MSCNNVIDDLKNGIETVWINQYKENVGEREKINGHGFVELKAAQNRLMRFMPYIAKVFPETADRKGIIESELVKIDKTKQFLNENGAGIEGTLLLKKDCNLPISGSVKARGGIYEVLKIAETLAVDKHMLHPTENYEKIDSEEFRRFYGKYTIQVGSTGNLGLSIGIMGAKLGFKVIVHMSADAKQWKKEMLRSNGVTVMEYDTDYTEAVQAGREAAEKDEYSFFIDDEKSVDLFMGYATAAMRLKVQLFKNGVSVDENHPLFVYIPCGVGGAPGGVTFGLKQMFGNCVHCFTVEPVQAPCLLAGLAIGKWNDISVKDLGLSGKTKADGLAVARPSGFVCEMLDPLLSGAFTVKDERLLSYLKEVYEKENIFLEPSACAGFFGAEKLMQSDEGKNYIRENGLKEQMKDATHIVWATGGGLVPQKERERYIKGESYIAPSADVIGDVTLDENANVWYHATIRADADKIYIGRNSNIQDNCVIHVDEGYPVYIGEKVTVGHGAIIHGCEIGECSLIGMGAVLLNGCKIGKNCLIGAGTLVTGGTEVPDGSVVIGNPGKVVRKIKDEELEANVKNAVKYAEKAKNGFGK